MGRSERVAPLYLMREEEEEKSAEADEDENTPSMQMRLNDEVDTEAGLASAPAANTTGDAPQVAPTSEQEKENTEKHVMSLAAPDEDGSPPTPKQEKENTSKHVMSLAAPDDDDSSK